MARTEAEVLRPLAQGEPRLRVARAQALARGGAGEEGLADLRALVQGEGARLPYAHEALAELYVSRKDYEPAIRAYLQALTLAPDASTNARVYLALAETYAAAEQLSQAARVLGAARTLYPGHPKVLLALARVRLRLGQESEGKAVLVEFLEQVPGTHPDYAGVAAEVERLGGR